MLGFSVYLSNIDTAYIRKMLDKGFNTIFTSLQITEEDINDKFQLLKDLKNFVGSEATLIVDINPRIFDEIEASIDGESQLGFDAIRFDESVVLERIVNWSKHSKVVLNASTDALNILRGLKDMHFDYSKVIVMHNYYPRPETGLDVEFFYKQNVELKRDFPDVNILAFVCGSDLRGPIYKGLPTVENHRDLRPIIAYKQLKDMLIDIVVIGDTTINDCEMDVIREYITDDCLMLRAEIDNGYDYLFDMVHSNRLDVARDVVRSQDHRKIFKDEVVPYHCIDRSIGSITLDNHLYGRYMNELQITKCDLPANDAVNVIGNVIEEDLDLIELIDSGTKFKFVRK